MGTLIIGAAVIVFGALNYISEMLANDVFRIAGAVLLAVSVIAGLGMSFYAMMKYNKGIF